VRLQGERYLLRSKNGCGGGEGSGKKHNFTTKYFSGKSYRGCGIDLLGGMGICVRRSTGRENRSRHGDQNHKASCCTKEKKTSPGEGKRGGGMGQLSSPVAYCTRNFAFSLTATGGKGEPGSNQQGAGLKRWSLPKD